MSQDQSLPCRRPTARTALTLIIAGTILLLAAPVQSRPSRKVLQPSPSPSPFGEVENIRLQRERLEFEKEKARSEAERAEKTIKVEESKVFWSALATAVPLAVGVIAIVAGFLNQHRQAKHQFELKAAEIIFSGTTPQAVLTRGKALRAIFSNYLSGEFLRDFTPEDLGGFKEPSEEKLVFLDHILKNPNKQSEIIELWFHLFPSDFTWLSRIDPTQFKNMNLEEINKHLGRVQTSAGKPAEDLREEGKHQ